MYDTEREALYSQYQDATKRIALLSVRHMAQAVTDTFPGAAVIVLEDSDQGDFLSTVGVLDAEANELADGEGVEEAYEDTETAWNLSSGIPREAWEEFIEGDGHVYRLDVVRALKIQPADFAPKPPLVQIIHGRDPDNGCDHSVFVNDEIDHHAEIEDIDPGRGYDRADWNDRVEGYLHADTNFGRAALGEIEAYADSQFIGDEVARLVPNPPHAEDVYAQPENNTSRADKADRWFAQTGGIWQAVAAHESEADWFDGDTEPADLPTPRVLSVDEIPTSGTLLWRDHRGDEFTYTNETPEGT